MRTLQDIATDPRPGDVVEVGPPMHRRRWIVLRVTKDSDGQPLVQYARVHTTGLASWREIVRGEYSEHGPEALGGWALPEVAK